VGNRLLGERSSALMGFEQQKLAAGVLCLSRFVPLLFMGEEYGETAPFQYFVDHGDPALLKAVREGRANEFGHADLGDAVPDPGARETLERCILNDGLLASTRHEVLYRLYQALLGLRSALISRVPDECVPFEAQRVLLVRREDRAFIVYCFSAQAQELRLPVPIGEWEVAISSADTEWQGPGGLLSSNIHSAGEAQLRLPPYSFVCCVRSESLAQRRALEGVIDDAHSRGGR
jgi:maltooligosyltrehalose trehalohydrolase